MQCTIGAKMCLMDPGSCGAQLKFRSRPPHLCPTLLFSHSFLMLDFASRRFTIRIGRKPIGRRTSVAGRRTSTRRSVRNSTLRRAPSAASGGLQRGASVRRSQSGVRRGASVRRAPSSHRNSKRMSALMVSRYVTCTPVG